MLNEVLAHKPATWDSEPYGQTLYRKIQVSGYEYNRVTEELASELRTRVESVYRIQNPYVYGRYKLRVEQLQLRNAVTEETWYHPISEEDMEVVMKYNCDYRRYRSSSFAQSSGKKPQFYRHAECAVQYFRPSGRMALVVVKVASTSPSIFRNECCKDWDTEYYPDYIVVLH